MISQEDFNRSTIYFFFAFDCPICHAIFVTLKGFPELWNRVKSISLLHFMHGLSEEQQTDIVKYMSNSTIKLPFFIIKTDDKFQEMEINELFKMHVSELG
jgi:hypothetical protein